MARTASYDGRYKAGYSINPEKVIIETEVGYRASCRPMRSRSLLVLAFAVAIGCAPSPAPGTPGRSTLTAPPTPTAQTTATPTPSPTPSPSPVGREIDAAKFTQHGGCGDTFFWAATDDNLTAITVEWRGAASQAWDDEGFEASAELPDGDIRVVLVTGRLLSTIYCNDVLMPNAGSDAEVPAISGDVSLAVRPDAGGFRPASHADLTLEDVEFEVNLGSETEIWRLDSFAWEDEFVGWLAG